MTDEFVSKLDKMIANLKSQEESDKQTSDQNLSFAKLIFLDLAETAHNYAEILRSKGINPKVSVGRQSISFELKYKGGGYRSLHVSTDIDTNMIQLETHYTDDKRSVRSTDGRYRESDWKNDIFNEAMEKTIENYIYYARRNGGLS